MNIIKKNYECQCGDEPCKFVLIYHKAIFGNKWEDSWEPELYLTSFLPEFSFFKRIWTAIKYIFGFKCEFGHFGETMIKPENCIEMANLLHEYRCAYNDFFAKMDRVRMDEELARKASGQK